MGTLLCALALATAGCGGGPAEESEPGLPEALAGSLAATSDEIAELLEAGQDCEAEALAAELRDDAEAAVADGRVPVRLEEPLLAAVARLAGGISCTPEPAPAAAAAGDPPGREKPKKPEKEKKPKPPKDDRKAKGKEKGKRP